MLQLYKKNFFTTTKIKSCNYKKIVAMKKKKKILCNEEKNIFFCFLSGHSIKWWDSPELKKVLILVLMQKKEAIKAIKCPG